MKLRKVMLENVKSFLDSTELNSTELNLDGDISIVIGPNGGGKTNLLDTVNLVLRKYLLLSVTPNKSPTPEVPDRFQFTQNHLITQAQLERHSQAQEKKQEIKIEIEVTKRDIENIVLMKDTAAEVTRLTEQRYSGFSIKEAADWDLSLLSAGQRFTYSIENNSLNMPEENKQAAQIYKRYLELYEIYNYLREDLGYAKLSTPMISLPVNRSSGQWQSSVQLAVHKEVDHKHKVDAAYSEESGSIITWAIGRLARKHRLLEQDKTRNVDEFYADPEIKSLTDILLDLGYDWNLKCINIDSNHYDIELKKQGAKFLVKNASSGEKELLIYLFAIYGLNVRDALIIVDEPELHLHPRWQRKLLDLFERLSKETGNQFLLATHSPVFVSPASIQYVSRVYSNEQKSAIVRLNNEDPLEKKHLFSIVNSHNNERIFFADKVVLVEGITDYIFFNAVFQKFEVTNRTTQTCEIISVGGKNFFSPYEKILKAFNIPYAVIADLDYLDELSSKKGSEKIKELFTINHKKIKKNVFDDSTSKDGDALVRRIDEAISSGNLDDLKSLWDHIKKRRRTLLTHLSSSDQKLVSDFVESQRKENIFVLSKGDLESYLPEGYRSKDIDKLLRFIESDFWSELPDFAQNEFKLIAEMVKEL